MAQHWQEILSAIGFEVLTVAGEGPVDRLVPGLAIKPQLDVATLASSDTADHNELTDEVAAALCDVDLTVVENLCTIPLNLPAARAVAKVLAGRPAILHHHDPPWQRDRFAAVTELPPDDPNWQHVVINRLTSQQFGKRGIHTTVIYNGFDTNATPGNRAELRNELGIAHNTLLIAHPVRAIYRKNIPVAVSIAEKLKGTYWLMGEAEEDYQPTLDTVLAAARCPVIHQSTKRTPDIYAAADLVVFPSLWEGFGNPPIEAAIWGKPCVVGDYPVARELAQFGFKWFSPEHLEEMQFYLNNPDAEVNRQILAYNQQIALKHFSLDRVRDDLEELLSTAGWCW